MAQRIHQKLHIETRQPDEGEWSSSFIRTRINVDLDIQPLLSLEFLETIVECLDVLCGGEISLESLDKQQDG